MRLNTNNEKNMKEFYDKVRACEENGIIPPRITKRKCNCCGKEFVAPSQYVITCYECKQENKKGDWI